MLPPKLPHNSKPISVEAPRRPPSKSKLGMTPLERMGLRSIRRRIKQPTVSIRGGLKVLGDRTA